jgi:hypothetical protein
VVGTSFEYVAFGTAGDTGDAFVRKYDAAREEQWSRAVASNQADYGQAIGLDSSGNVYASGVTNGEVTDYLASWDQDGFLVKYSPSGDRNWIRQFGTSSEDDAAALAVEPSGNVYVAGRTDGAFDGNDTSIRPDGYLRKYDTSGAVLWTREFGSDQIDGTASVALGGVGNVYVGGTTWAVNRAPDDAYELVVRKFDVSGNGIWERTFGANTKGEGYGVVAANATGVYMTGYTWGALPGQSNSGDADAFVLEMAP